MRKIMEIRYVHSFIEHEGDNFQSDFNNARIYFALITKLDIFNGCFINSFNKLIN